MIDKIKFNYAVSKYKTAFNDEWWNEEKFKWEAVKCFQENWNIEEDFIEMFTNATAKTYNLLASNHNYPRGMIIEFAQNEPETVRNMFTELYNEDIDLSRRVTDFKEKSEELRRKYSDGTWNNHYQNENSISTYLWLKYPDKYYIYKYSEVKKVAKLLDDGVIIKAGKKIENLITCYEFYDKINELLKGDLNLINSLKSKIKSDQYDDLQLKTLTIDFGFLLVDFERRE